MSDKIIIPSGTICYPSVFGRKNFVYPDKETGGFCIIDTPAQKIEFMSVDKDLIPVKIKTSIVPAFISGIKLNNTGTYAVFWIHKIPQPR
jgi:hypothetical protein